MRARRAFTIVELLVVIAIIGALVALLLPAVQAAREAARRTQCKNNLKQLALASLEHEEAHRFFPTGGWGARWVGDPDLGYDESQPGGWAFNLLPFIERTEIRDMAKGLSHSERRAAGARMVSVPMAEFICPSRRPATAYPYHHPTQPDSATFLFNIDTPEMTSRTDYAVNSGTIYPGWESGPPSPDGWTWPSWDAGPRPTEDPRLHDYVHANNSNGISYQRSKVKFAQITGGSSNTYLIGEKYLCTDCYDTGICNGDLVSLLNGHNVSLNRWAGRKSLPFKDMPDFEPGAIFGGPHDGGFHMALCDGSVDRIAYEIDPQVHHDFGDRN